jgi:hypothetical protein
MAVEAPNRSENVIAALVMVPSMPGRHLGPDEAAQLPGDGGGHDILGVLPRRQTSEPAAQPALCAAQDQSA